MSNDQKKFDRLEDVIKNQQDRHCVLCDESHDPEANKKKLDAEVKMARDSLSQPKHNSD